MSSLDTATVLDKLSKCEIFSAPLGQNDIKISSLGSGYLNVTALIEIVNKDRSDRSGIRKLVYKEYGGNSKLPGLESYFTVQPPFIQSLIAYEYDRRGWGPKVYGIFEDCRIESYVESKPLDRSEAFNDCLVHDVAQAFANFHSIKLPISKETPQLFSKFLSTLDEFKDNVNKWIDDGSMGKDFIQEKKLRQVVSFPFADEINWIYKISSKVKQRRVLCTVDTHYLNRLIRDKAATGATRTVLIDYDLVCYAPRGVDLSGHFVNRMFDWSMETKSSLSGSPFPNSSEQHKFILSYLKNFETHCDDFDGKNLDTPDNLFLEISVNCFAYLILILAMTRWLLPLFKMNLAKCDHIPVVLSLYDQFKCEFKKRYPQLLD